MAKLIKGRCGRRGLLDDNFLYLLEFIVVPKCPYHENNV